MLKNKTDNDHYTLILFIPCGLPLHFFFSENVCIDIFFERFSTRLNTSHFLQPSLVLMDPSLIALSSWCENSFFF